MFRTTRTRLRMGPHCEQTVQNSIYLDSAQGTADDDTASPETDSSTPSTPSTPSPPPEENVEGNELAVQMQYPDMNPPLLMPDGLLGFLPIDYNLPQVLKQVSGTDDLTTVKEIKLRVLSQEMSLQRLSLYMPALRELNLSGSCLNSLRELGCGLSNLRVLKVDRCGLDSLDGTFGLTTLWELHAAYNKVEDVSPATTLPNIRLVNLRRNLVDDIAYIGFLSICVFLEHLVLEECPVSYEEGYRSEIRRMLPHLELLDGIPVGINPEEYVPPSSDKDHKNDDDDDDINDIQKFDIPNRNWIRNFNMNTASPQSSSTDNDESSSSMHSTENETCSTNQLNSTEKRQRPVTAGVKNSSAVKDILNTQRPSSARPAISTQKGETEIPASLSNSRTASPSVLTSGPVVYGNLTAALRGRKKNVTTAWGERQKRKVQELMPYTSLRDLKYPLDYKEELDGELTEIVNLNMNEEPVTVEKGTNQWQKINDSLSGKNMSDAEGPQDLLTLSKSWREAYSSYRKENSAKWEKEKLEDCTQENKHSKNLEAHKKVMARIQEKQTNTCCSVISEFEKIIAEKNKKNREVKKVSKLN